MGVHAGKYHSIARTQYRVGIGTITNSQLIEVDGSHTLHRVTDRRNIGYRCLTLDPRGEYALVPVTYFHLYIDTNASESLVKDVSAEIARFLSPFPKERLVIRLEGSIEKPRHAQSKETTNAKLNNLLKTFYKGKLKWRREFVARKYAKLKKDVSKAYGRPPPWITILIAQRLKQDGFAVTYSDTIENDFVIAKSAAAYEGEVIVVGDDSDFIGFSPPNSVTRIVNVDKKTGRWRHLEKKNVLEELKLTNFELALAFAIAGCDNVEAHVGNFGWVKAMEYLETTNKIELTNLMEFSEIPLQSKKSEVKAAMMQQFKSVIDKSGWYDSTQHPVELDPTPNYPPKSQLMVLAEDTGRTALNELMTGRWSPPQRGKKGKIAPKIPFSIEVSNSFALLEFKQQAQKVYDEGMLYLYMANLLIISSQDCFQNRTMPMMKQKQLKREKQQLRVKVQRQMFVKRARGRIRQWIQ